MHKDEHNNPNILHCISCVSHMLILYQIKPVSFNPGNYKDFVETATDQKYFHLLQTYYLKEKIAWTWNF